MLAAGREGGRPTRSSHLRNVRQRSQANTRKSAASLEVNHQEEGVDDDVEEEGGERVARVAVVPQKDLRGHHDGRVEQRYPAEEHHAWAHELTRGRAFRVRNSERETPACTKNAGRGAGGLRQGIAE